MNEPLYIKLNRQWKTAIDHHTMERCGKTHDQDEYDRACEFVRGLPDADRKQLQWSIRHPEDNHYDYPDCANWVTAGQIRVSKRSWIADMYRMYYDEENDEWN